MILAPSGEPPRILADGYVRVDNTTWPIDTVTANHEAAEWELRYGDPLPRRLFIASLLNAYNHLTDPEISQTDAMRSLRRARVAAKLLRSRPTSEGQKP